MKEVTTRAIYLSNQPITEIETRVLPLKTNTRNTDDQIESRILKSKICFNLIEGSIIISIFDIIRLESSSNYTIVYTTDSKKIVVSKTMKMLEEVLPADQFIRCHNSHIINVDQIKSFKKGSLVLYSNKELPIARQKYQDVVQLIHSKCITL